MTVIFMVHNWSTKTKIHKYELSVLDVNVCLSLEAYVSTAHYLPSHSIFGNTMLSVSLLCHTQCLHQYQQILAQHEHNILHKDPQDHLFCLFLLCAREMIKEMSLCTQGSYKYKKPIYASVSCGSKFIKLVVCWHHTEYIDSKWWLICLAKTYCIA